MPFFQLFPQIELHIPFEDDVLGYGCCIKLSNDLEKIFTGIVGLLSVSKQ